MMLKRRQTIQNTLPSDATTEPTMNKASGYLLMYLIVEVALGVGPGKSRICQIIAGFFLQQQHTIVLLHNYTIHPLPLINKIKI